MRGGPGVLAVAQFPPPLLPVARTRLFAFCHGSGHPSARPTESKARYHRRYRSFDSRDRCRVPARRGRHSTLRTSRRAPGHGCQSGIVDIDHPMMYAIVETRRSRSHRGCCDRPRSIRPLPCPNNESAPRLGWCDLRGCGCPTDRGRFAPQKKAPTRPLGPPSRHDPPRARARSPARMTGPPTT